MIVFDFFMGAGPMAVECLFELELDFRLDVGGREAHQCLEIARLGHPLLRAVVEEGEGVAPDGELHVAPLARF